MCCARSGRPGEEGGGMYFNAVKIEKSSIMFGRGDDCVRSVRGRAKKEGRKIQFPFLPPPLHFPLKLVQRAPR